MKKRGRTDLFLILCGILIWFLTDATRIRAQAAEALILCGKSVIPALFPFLVVSSLLIALGFGEWVSPYLAGLMAPLFRLPGLASSALFLGLVGGYPIGAQTAADLYCQRLLTREEAERLLGYRPRYSNKDALVRNYEWYVEHLPEFAGQSGVSHRVPWKQGLLAVAKWFF